MISFLRSYIITVCLPLCSQYVTYFHQLNYSQEIFQVFCILANSRPVKKRRANYRVQLSNASGIISQLDSCELRVYICGRCPPPHQHNSDATLPAGLGNECRIFVSWQTSCPWNEEIHSQASSPSTIPASNTRQCMTYHSTPCKGSSSSLLVLLARVNKSLETPLPAHQKLS